MNNDHIQHLRHTLTLAQIRKGFCAPNPSVGVAVVKNGQILATGYHQAAGEPHAEVEALKRLSVEESMGATVYVSLEPCCHQGKTPPCTELLIQRGVKAVYYGFTDPNPLVLGEGQRQLQAAGIECAHLPLLEIDAFYQSYSHWTQTRLPWVTAKLAISLDGKIAGPGGARVAITGSEAQVFTHQYRKQSDAILTTVKTVICDDPQLNVRLPGEKTAQKVVYVLDKNLDFPLNAKLFHTTEKLILFHDALADKNRRLKLEAQGAYCATLPLQDGKINVTQALAYIGNEGVQDLLLEAGGTCFEAFILANHIQRAFVYVAPKWLGPEAQSAFNHKTVIFERMQNLKWHVLGEDVVCEFIPNWSAGGTPAL